MNFYHLRKDDGLEAIVTAASALEAKKYATGFEPSWESAKVKKIKHPFSSFHKRVEPQKKYEVCVSNIGTAYSGNSLKDAISCYAYYKCLSKEGIGRTGNETVTLFENNDIKWEYEP